MGALKLVPVWAWVLLGLLLSTGYLYLRLDHTKTDLAGVRGERDIAIARAASIGKTLDLQRQLTEDSNKATDHATKQAQHVTAAVAVADDRARSLQQQVTDLLANRKRCPADLATTGKTRDDLAAVLADLRRSADEEAGGLAAALGLLDKVGCDPVGIGAIYDAMIEREIPPDKIAAISQGWKLGGAIKTAERKLAEGGMKHGGQGKCLRGDSSYWLARHCSGLSVAQSRGPRPG